MYFHCALLPRWFAYVLTLALHLQDIVWILAYVAEDSLMGRELLQPCLRASCTVFDHMRWRCWHSSLPATPSARPTLCVCSDAFHG